MRLFAATALCLSLLVSSTWTQSTVIQSSSDNPSSTISVLASSGSLINNLLHPLRPFLGEAGHKALHNAIETIPMSVLNQVNNLGQMFKALITFNPSAVRQLINQFFPGASSMFSSFIPSLGSAGSTLSSMASSGSSEQRASQLNSFFRQNFPAYQSDNNGASGSASTSRGFGALNPVNIASNLVGRGMANFAGVTNSLANGQPMNALLTIANGAADTVNRVTSTGLNMASQAAQTATSLASRLPGPLGQMSSNFASMAPGLSSSSFSSSGSSSSGSGRGRPFSSPLGNLFANNPFTGFFNGR